MRLRPIEERDLEAVRELRNRNRAWFFDDGEVSADAQRAWFDGLADTPVDFYVIEVDDRVVGTISATRREDGVEIGNLTLDEGYRGRGLMTRAVEELCRGAEAFFAVVKADNDASRRVFERAGFDVGRLYLERRGA